GTQLVELALVLPILMAFFAATAEFGRYFYNYSTLAKATRAGARMMATTTVKDVTAAGLANRQQDARIRRLVVYGDPNASDGSRPIVPGLTVDNVDLKREGPVLSVPSTVTVRIVNYNYKPLINLGGFSKSLNWTAVPLKPSTTMRFLLTQPTPPGT
ncbi:MAG TPA: TadE family protein, partial [Pyrinomonadaceae bacterium]